MDLPRCDIPPRGWRCTRASGHSGPCAAVPNASRAASFFRGLFVLLLPLILAASVWAGIAGLRHWQHERYLRTHWCAIDREVSNVGNATVYHFRMVTCKEVEESGNAGIEANGSSSRQNMNAQSI